MDVPISLALILATSISLYETMHSGEKAYFDAAVNFIKHRLDVAWNAENIFDS